MYKQLDYYIPIMAIPKDDEYNLDNDEYEVNNVYIWRNSIYITLVDYDYEVYRYEHFIFTVFGKEIDISKSKFTNDNLGLDAPLLYFTGDDDYD